MVENIEIFPAVLIRQPALSNNLLFRNFRTLADIIKFLNENPSIKKAIISANSSVSKEIEKFCCGKIKQKKELRNLFLTLQNYLLRMATRPTPFKQFSNITFGTVNESQKEYVNNLLLKDHYFKNISVSKYELKSNLLKDYYTLRINSSLIKKGDYYFIEIKTNENNSRRIQSTVLLDKIVILSQKWISVLELWKIVKKEYPFLTKNDFSAYLSQLISINFLIYKSDVSIDYKINELRVAKNTIVFGNSFKKQLLDVIMFLSTFSDSTYVYPNWEKFKNYFLENYQFVRLPLKEVVYGDEFPDWQLSEAKIKNSVNYQKLLDEIIRQELENKSFIQLPKNFLNNIKWEKNQLDGEILASIVVPNTGLPFIIVDSGIGSSQVGKIVGRFYDLLDNEQQKKLFAFQQNEDRKIIKAEIIFDSHDRRINAIINNTIPYSYFININSNRVLLGNELMISDLSIGIDQNGLYLWSEKLNAEIKPCFSNAINPDMIESKLYRFLSALDKNRFNKFNPILPFTYEHNAISPRIVWKNIILKRKQWHLDYEFKKLMNKNISVAFDEWVLRNNVDQFIGFSLGEAPTIYNLENKVHKKIVEKEIWKNRNQIDSIIFLEVPEIDLSNNITQIVVEFKSQKKNSLPYKPFSEYELEVPRLTPLKNFLSITLFPSKFLQDSLIPVKEIVNSLTLDNYFFINYLDNDRNSIRLRICEKDSVKLLSQIQIVLAKLLSKKIIYDYSITPFLPEYARYGGKNNYQQIVNFFEIDSKSVLTNEKSLNYQDLSILGIVICLESCFYTFESANRLLNIDNTIVSKHLETSSNLKSEKLYKLARQSEEVQFFEQKIIPLLKSLEYVQQEVVIASLIHMHFNRAFKPNKEEEKILNLKILQLLKIREGEKKWHSNQMN